MKIAVIGGAGAMGRTAVMDLRECPEVDIILVADYQEDKAILYAESFCDPRIKGTFIDAREVNNMATMLKGYDAVINTAQYDVNLNIMEACLKAGCHYNDLGGMFHITRKQLKLFDDFKKAGLTAILGMGSAPGITNVLAKYAYDRLDEVEIVRILNADVDLTDTKGISVFRPPYSIQTILEEYTYEPIEFIDGEFKTLPPLSGAMEVYFPEPIGMRTCIHTLHSEPATIPYSFREKRIKEVTWRLSLTPDFEEKARFLAFIGFGNTNSIVVEGKKVIPRKVLCAVVEKHLMEKLRGVELKAGGLSYLRANVIGKRGDCPIEYNIDCLSKPHSRWGVFCETSSPPVIVAQMQIKGTISSPGVWAPEQVIDPTPFFTELSKREIHIQTTVKEYIP